MTNKIIKFEGDYLNGKKWNGKGYHPNGKKVYEISDGKGMIEEYNESGKLLYEENFQEEIKMEKGNFIICLGLNMMENF